MRHIGLVGIALTLVSCHNKASVEDDKSDTYESVWLEYIAIPDTEPEQAVQPTRKYDFQPGPDPELEYFDEHFDDYYFDDPEDLSTYPDEIFDFYCD